MTVDQIISQYNSDLRDILDQIKAPGASQNTNLMRTLSNNINSLSEQLTEDLRTAER